MLYKRVMFICCPICQRLEPVCVMSYAILFSPLYHTCSHSVSYFSIESCTVVYDINHFFIDIFRQVLIHFLAVEYLFTEILIRSFRWSFYVEWLFLKSLFHDLK